jgi:hypothetical protein
MTLFITGLIGIAGFLIFLGIMLWWVKAIPLIIIVACTAALLIYDYVQTLRFGENATRR